MPDFIYEIPQRDLALYFALAAVGSILFGLLILKPLLRLLFGAGPDLNESIGYATSGFNLFYGLLLGLITVAAYQNSERVKEGILSEAMALSSLYADMDAYPEPIRTDMKASLRDYVLYTIYKDWDAHRGGRFLNGGGNRANVMRHALAKFNPATPGQEIMHAAVTNAFHDFIEARQRRIVGVSVAIPDVLWYAVIVGAAINILLLIMLRMRPMQQLLLGSITTFFLGVILFVIITLDDPLRGVDGLDPWPFQLLWERQMIWDD